MFATGFILLITHEVTWRVVFIQCFSYLVFGFYCVSCWVLVIKVYGPISEYWWSVMYSYYRHLLVLNWQKWLYFRRLKRVKYYKGWYNLQCNRKLWNSGWVVVFIIIKVVCIWIFINLCFGRIWQDHYFLYWFKFLWIFGELEVNKFFIWVQLYIILKLWCSRWVSYYILINIRTDGLGIVTTNMYKYCNIFTSRYTDYKYRFCYDKQYFRFFENSTAYEFPVSWCEWNQYVIDQYYIETLYLIQLIGKLVKYWVFSTLRVYFDYSREITMFSFEYSFLVLEQHKYYQ